MPTVGRLIAQKQLLSSPPTTGVELGLATCFGLAVMGSVHGPPLGLGSRQGRDQLALSCVCCQREKDAPQLICCSTEDERHVLRARPDLRPPGPLPPDCWRGSWFWPSVRELAGNPRPCSGRRLGRGEMN